MASYAVEDKDKRGLVSTGFWEERWARSTKALLRSLKAQCAYEGTILSRCLAVEEAAHAHTNLSVAATPMANPVTR